MSLKCVRCERVIVQSDNPDHYGVCHQCGVIGMTEEEKEKIEQHRLGWKQEGKMTTIIAIIDHISTFFFKLRVKRMLHKADKLEEAMSVYIRSRRRKDGK